jgi:hypothetical protein
MEQAAAHVHGVTGHRHESLHERGVRILRLVDLVGRLEDHHVAALRFSVPRQVDLVNGTCGPYASLFTNSQSPTSSVGIMLPDGIRYASKRNVRMKKKIASVQTMALMLSIVDDGRSDGAALPPRRAATEFTGASD